MSKITSRVYCFSFPLFLGDQKQFCPQLLRCSHLQSSAKVAGQKMWELQGWKLSLVSHVQTLVNLPMISTSCTYIAVSARLSFANKNMRAYTAVGRPHAVATTAFFYVWYAHNPYSILRNRQCKATQQRQAGVCEASGWNPTALFQTFHSWGWCIQAGFTHSKSIQKPFIKEWDSTWFHI